MSLSSWWRKRNGILKEEPLPVFQAIERENKLIITSSLKYETICDEIEKSYPPPTNFLWRLMAMKGYTPKYGFYIYDFELEEK